MGSAIYFWPWTVSTSVSLKFHWHRERGPSHCSDGFPVIVVMAQKVDFAFLNVWFNTLASHSEMVLLIQTPRGALLWAGSFCFRVGARGSLGISSSSICVIHAMSLSVLFPTLRGSRGRVLAAPLRLHFEDCPPALSVIALPRTKDVDESSLDNQPSSTLTPADRMADAVCSSG